MTVPSGTIAVRPTMDHSSLISRLDRELRRPLTVRHQARPVPNPADDDLRLELRCADDFGVGDVAEEKRTQLDWEILAEYDTTVERHLMLVDRAFAAGIGSWVKDKSDADSRHSDASLYFHADRLRDVERLLLDLGLPGDILTVPKRFSAKRAIAIGQRHGWLVERDSQILYRPEPTPKSNPYMHLPAILVTDEARAWLGSDLVDQVVAAALEQRDAIVDQSGSCVGDWCANIANHITDALPEDDAWTAVGWVQPDRGQARPHSWTLVRGVFVDAAADQFNRLMEKPFPDILIAMPQQVPTHALDRTARTPAQVARLTETPRQVSGTTAVSRGMTSATRANPPLPKGESARQMAERYLSYHNTELLQYPDLVERIARGISEADNPIAYALRAAYNADVSHWKRKRAMLRKARLLARDLDLERALTEARLREAELVKRLRVEAQQIAATSETPHHVAAAVDRLFEGASYAQIQAKYGLSSDNAYQRVKRGRDEIATRGSAEMRDWLTGPRSKAGAEADVARWTDQVDRQERIRSVRLAAKQAELAEQAAMAQRPARGTKPDKDEVLVGRLRVEAEQIKASSADPDHVQMAIDRYFDQVTYEVLRERYVLSPAATYAGVAKGRKELIQRGSAEMLAWFPAYRR